MARSGLWSEGSMVENTGIVALDCVTVAIVAAGLEADDHCDVGRPRLRGLAGARVTLSTHSFEAREVYVTYWAVNRDYYVAPRLDSCVRSR